MRDHADNFRIEITTTPKSSDPFTMESTLAMKKQSLAVIDLLKPMQEKDRIKLEQRCIWRNIKHNEVILDRQSESSEIYFVVSGQVRVVNYSMSGREITFDDMGRGQYFGQLAALDNQPRSANVIAVEDSLLASLGRISFKELLLNYPEISLNLLTEMAQIIRTSTDRIMDLSTLGANNRVLAELLRLAHSCASNENSAIIKPVPVHSDVASRVSTTRETVARVFSDLSKRQLIQRNGDTLVIHDIVHLQEMVEDFRGI